MDEADPPLWDADTAAQAGDRVASWLQTRHPDLSSEAVKAVANDLTFSWK
jgi:hypothetical protein